MTFRIVNQACN